MDWRRSYTASWRVFRVNPATWADAELVGGVIEASLERSQADSDRLLEKGSLTIDVPPGTEFSEGYYRIAMTATQDGESERVDVCTLHCYSASGDVDRNVDTLEVTGNSVLYPASKTLLEDGSYAPKGIDGIQWCANLLGAAINAPVETMGSFTLDDHLVFDSGTYALDAVWQVLEAGGGAMQVRGDGTVIVRLVPTEVSLELSRANARLLHPGVHHELDFSSVPNRFFAVDGSERAQVINDDPASETSTVRRGWTNDVRESSPKRINGETLTAYARRRLSELSTVSDSRTYTREWWPDVLPYSVVKGGLADVGIEGDLRVKAQRLTMGRGVSVEEESFREVTTWQTS